MTTCKDCCSHNGMNFCYSHGNRTPDHATCKDFRLIPEFIREARDAGPLERT